MAIAAELVGTPNLKGRRGSIRREMTLRARGAPGAGNATDVLIRNLSTTGMLLEAAVGLVVGQKLVIDLPQIGHAAAGIVWADDNLFGCSFARPLSEAAVSAALLRSDPKSRPGEALPGPSTVNRATAQTLGERIRAIRLARGLSLVEFAHKMNVSRPTVWAWEANKNAPRPRKRQQLLKVLEVTESELEGPANLAAIAGQSEEAPEDESRLKSLVHQAKVTIADAAGTTPEKVTLIIEI
uniref:helix-turn-helix domain-containing protein n=1 Tax=Altererythrobacter segetis TaxID=1104773 RepID=UPI00140AD8FB|nr:helix-turn-helix transcriptional regulator [Altererythrobacter segetis]